MKIPNRLALLLLTAGLAACGSDLGSKGNPLPSTGAVITPNPITSPTEANKATVGFRVVFPVAAAAQKAAINPAMTQVTVTSSGACGNFSLILSPTNNTGVMNLNPGACTFTASAVNALNTTIDTASTQGTLLAGVNDISLSLLGGPWLFVDPITNEKLPLTLSNAEVLTGFDLAASSTSAHTLRWLGIDSGFDGPTTDDFKGNAQLTTPPATISMGIFSGGSGLGKNFTILSGGYSNTSTWEETSSTGDRIVQILGENPFNFNPATYTNNYTTRVIDGTTIEGNIAELTVASTALGTVVPGTCDPLAANAARSAAITNAALVGGFTAEWTQCAGGGSQLVTTTFSNVNIYPFRAKSYFAAPEGAIQIKFNAGMNAYKQALSSEDLINGTNMPLLRVAADNLVAAADLANSTQDLSSTGDAARFFGAISRLAALGVHSESDGDATNSLETFSDVLDALGVPMDTVTRDWSNLIEPPKTCVYYTYYTDCTPNLPATSPTSGAILTLLDSKLNTELDLAIADLSNIPAGFSYNFVDPQSFEVTNFDYGDVLALTAAAYGLKAELAIDMAYDLNLDIDATINGTGPASVQQFMLDNPTIGTLDASRFATELAQARTELQAGLNKMNEAITAIEAEGTDVISQQNEFITFYSSDGYCDPAVLTYCSWIEVNRTVEEIANFRDAISKALTGLNGPVTIDNNLTPTNTADDTIIDPSKFFAGISFRSLLPTFTGDVPDGLFPDATMGGVLVQGRSVNEDLDGNNKPDLLEDTNFYPALIGDKTFMTQTWTNNYNIYWSYFSFYNNNSSVSAVWNATDYTVYPAINISGTATGSWAIMADGTLEIAFTGGTAPDNMTGMNLSLEYYPGPLEENFNTKGTFTFSDKPAITTWSWWQKGTPPPVATVDVTFE